MHAPHLALLHEAARLVALVDDDQAVRDEGGPVCGGVPVADLQEHRQVPRRL